MMADVIMVTAPKEWLGFVNRDMLITEAMDLGWKARDWHKGVDRDPNSEWTHPNNLGSFHIPLPSAADYRTRILEAIEAISMSRGITAAEWFSSILLRHIIALGVS